MLRTEFGDWLQSTKGDQSIRDYVVGKLVRDAAKTVGAEVKPEEIDQRIDKRIEERVLTAFRGRKELFVERELTNYGKTMEQYRKELAWDMETDLLIQKTIKARRLATDADVEQEFRRLYGSSGRSLSIRAILIEIESPGITSHKPVEEIQKLTAAAVEAARKKGVLVVKRLQSGATDFASEARASSDDARSKVTGGDIGEYTVTPPEFGEAFDEALQRRSPARSSARSGSTPGTSSRRSPRKWSTTCARSATRSASSSRSAKPPSTKCKFSSANSCTTRSSSDSWLSVDATDRMKIGELRWFEALLALAFGILCLEVLSLNLAIHVDGSAPYTLIWPSSALALYVFMRYGISLWPAFLLADAFLPFFSDFNSVEALATAVADLATLPAAAWLLGRLGVTNNPLRSVRDFVAFILIGAIGASFLSTMFGLGTVFLFRPLSGTIGELLSEWGLEGAMSTIVFAPPMWIEWRRRDPARAGGRGELIAIFLYMTVVGYLAFFYDLEPKSWQRALPYLMVPGAIWAAIRFGPKGATSILLYGCTLAVVGTVRGNGPFATNPIQPGITNLQAFMGVTAMAALLIAAALSESLAARRALEASEGKYRNLVETSGDLIWSVDPQGRWTFINNAIHATHGYRPEDLLGKPFADLLYSEEQRAKDMAAFERIKTGESVFRYETIHRRRDGLPSS